MSDKRNDNLRAFSTGLKDGIPIALGYFAVSFALGIAAKNIGMNAIQSFFMSLGMVASAGEFAAITLISASAGIIEMIATSLIINLRYFLMSCSMTQKLSQKTSFFHRFLIAYCMTDEIFALSVSVDGFLNPFFTYGIACISVSGWCLGTVLGVLVGNIIPNWIASSLGIAVYGMFIAIVIPAAKKDRFTALLILISMLSSWAFSLIPLLKDISSGFQIIILTIIIAGIAAFIKPVDSSEES